MRTRADENEFSLEIMNYPRFQRESASHFVLSDKLPDYHKPKSLSRRRKDAKKKLGELSGIA